MLSAINSGKFSVHLFWTLQIPVPGYSSHPTRAAALFTSTDGGQSGFDFRRV